MGDSAPTLDLVRQHARALRAITNDGLLPSSI